MNTVESRAWTALSEIKAEQLCCALLSVGSDFIVKHSEAGITVAVWPFIKPEKS